MSIIGTIYDDVTTDVLGEIGSWQWLVTFLSTVLMLPSLFNQHEDMFLRKPLESEVVCVPPEKYEVVNASLCNYVIVNSTAQHNCNKWHVKLMWLIWLKRSWMVFCDHKLQVLSTAMICRLGFVFGCVGFGLVADSFGRKVAIIIDVFAELVLRLVITFCDSEGWFRLFVFLRSFFGSGNFFMGLVIICEVASNSWRSRLSAIVMSPRLLAVVCAVPLANRLPNPETVCFIACLLGAVLICILRWVPESPQWLMYNRKISVAETLLLNAAQRNGIRFAGEFKIRPVNYRAYNCLDETTTCMGVLTTYNIRALVLVTLLFWCIYNFLWSSIYSRVYSEVYTVCMWRSVLPMLFCILGLFGCLNIFLSKKLRLRQLLMCNIILTGGFTAAVVIFKQETIKRIISSLALASGLVAHALLLIITPRLFAINVRATMFGCCHATGQLGAMISYLVFLFQAMDDVIFVAVQVAVTLTLTSLCFLFPDVDGRELPDVMEDMDYFSELSKPLRWTTQKSISPSHEEVEIRVYSFGSADRTLSTRSGSEDRVPARLIGCIRYWRWLKYFIRQRL